MPIENIKNRDIFLKFCFMYFLVHILKVLGIDEEIDEILPSEQITFQKIGKEKIFDNFLDFQVLTKSGKILVFEFKKRALTNDDLKQAFEYYDRVHCKQKADVKLIIIVLSNNGRIKEYTKLDITFHPEIIKTKSINKQKDLSIIRHKLEHNNDLTLYECSLLVALPLFELEESEADITREVCELIKYKSDCIPNEIVDEISVAMYLNIMEYVEEEKRDELLEMINMAEKVQGIIAQIKNEGRNEGRSEGRREIISRLLKNHGIEEVAMLLGMKTSEILKMVDGK